jgi:recombination protein RecA
MSLIAKDQSPNLGVKPPISVVTTTTSMAKLPPLMKSERPEAIKEAIKSLEKEFEGIKIQRLGSKIGMRCPCLPTDMPTFDESSLVCGGIPDGRIIEVFGPPSAGKTTFCLHVIACAQRAGDEVAFVDAEHALDPNYARKIGVNVDDLFVCQPDYGEQALSVVIGLVKSRAYRIVVVDSVAALVPKAELDGEMGESHMGLQARMMSQAMRKLAGLCNSTGTTVIFINQVREKIGVVFGNPEVTTGGRALIFYSSVRIQVSRVANSKGGEIKDGDIHIGHRTRLKVVKNKVGPPFRETEVSILYDSGFDVRDDWTTYAIDINAVTTGTQTKENKGKDGDNGVPKSWFGFEGTNYRRNELTLDPVFEKMKSAALLARDRDLASSKEV